MINKYTGHCNIYSSFGLLLCINTLVYTSVRLYNTGRSHFQNGRNVTLFTVQKKSLSCRLLKIESTLINNWLGECLYNYWTDLLDWVLSYWVQLTPTWNKSLNSLLQLLIIASVLSVITSTVKNKKIFFVSNINRLKHFFIKWYA